MAAAFPCQLRLLLLLLLLVLVLLLLLRARRYAEGDAGETARRRLQAEAVVEPQL